MNELSQTKFASVERENFQLIFDFSYPNLLKKILKISFCVYYGIKYWNFLIVDNYIELGWDSDHLDLHMPSKALDTAIFQRSIG